MDCYVYGAPFRMYTHDMCNANAYYNILVRTKHIVLYVSRTRCTCLPVLIVWCFVVLLHTYTCSSRKGVHTWAIKFYCLRFCCLHL